VPAPPLTRETAFQENNKSKEEKNDVAADDGNVLNIIARALLARRAAIKDEDENEDEELWE
jgi:hypothetical protein